MCKLTSIHGSKCGHILKVEYTLCQSAPVPNRCPTMISSIESSSRDPQTPFCPKCSERMKAEIIANFHKERAEMTRVARARHWTDEDISVMRIELRDRLYARLKYVNRPLPPLPSSTRGK